jgi:hypothetical protein
VRPEPKHYEARFAKSPIKRDKAARMSDAQWLRAMARYKSDAWSRCGGTSSDGGARELASQMQQLTKRHPLRFANLATTIPDEANTVYLQQILWGLAEVEDIDDDALSRVVANAHSRPNKP